VGPKCSTHDGLAVRGGLPPSLYPWGTPGNPLYPYIHIYILRYIYIYTFYYIYIYNYNSLYKYIYIYIYILRYIYICCKNNITHSYIPWDQTKESTQARNKHTSTQRARTRSHAVLHVRTTDQRGGRRHKVPSPPIHPCRRNRNVLSDLCIE
jgi:hypothetical protein